MYKSYYNISVEKGLIPEARKSSRLDDLKRCEDDFNRNEKIRY
jgi:hypothetical protein